MMKYTLLFIALFSGSLLAVAEPQEDAFATDEMSDDFSAPVTESAAGDADLNPGQDQQSGKTVQADAVQPGEDRLEEWNKKVFKFNDTIDRYFLKPIAKGYDKVTPSIVNRGVSNVFTMLGELPNAGNAVLQQKPIAAGDSVLRFMINATVGVLGFFDVAAAIGIEEHKEDFGQTLAYWGVPPGHYIVLPFWGSSTIRNLHGLFMDGFVNPLNRIEETPTYVAVRSLEVVDDRADLLKAEELISGDRYSFLKNAYLQNRHYLENDGKVEDTFDNATEEDSDWLE